jgi:RNase H-fold protein (predicted Holliday junction resolvase)
MAMSGKKTPDLGAVRIGCSRGEAELQLGPPVKTVTLENNGREDVYEYEVGNDPSAGRAIGHGVMDVLTLGLWEVAGTPIEAVQGSKHTITVIYDVQDKVVSINRPAPPEQTAQKPAGEENKAVAQKLKDLQDLRSQGLITEVEYSDQRTKILEGFSKK